MKQNRKDLKNFMSKKKVYILVIALIFMITAIGYTLTNVTYRASQKILVSEEKSHLLSTYQEIMKGSTNLEKVIQNLNLQVEAQDLAKAIEVSVVDDTNMLEIKVSGEQEEQIQKISNEILQVFLQQVNEIYGDTELYPVDKVAQYEKNENVILVGICAGIIGFLASTLVFWLSWLLDTKIKSCKDIEEITGLKSLISIPYIPMIAKKKWNIKMIRSQKSDVFKVLMTNIQFVNNTHSDSKSILLTSPHSLEGKTYVATNLAIEFAKAGKKVILIDADMRKGRIAKIFNLPNDLGFSNYLSDLDSNGNRIHERITRFIHDTEIKNLSVITAGNTPPNPSELLKNEKVKELIKELKIFYDIILLDTVSLLEVPEATQLAQNSDLCLILSSYGTTKRDTLIKAYEQINKQGENCIGMAFNRVPERKLKKKIAIFQSDVKKNLGVVGKKVTVFWNQSMKFFQKFHKLGEILKNFGAKIVGGLAFLQKGMGKMYEQIKNKSQDVKEYFRNYKTKKEAVKLIEAGSLPEEKENNIIKEVFEKEIAKLEKSEAEYQKKLDSLKANLDEKNELLKTKPVEPKPELQEKSKFDLIREQQKKEAQENVFSVQEVKQELPKSEEKKEKVKIEPQISREIIEIEMPHIQIQKEKQDLAFQKEEAKKKRREQIEQYQEIDLSKQEHITEEMIRQQVEMDDMIRLAEQEEAEENLRLKQMKKEEKMQKRQERKQKIQKFFHNKKNEEEQEVFQEERIRKMEAKIEQKIKKETEKNEYKQKIEKEKEEKRAYRQIQKQRQKEELRLREELQEDNLYPKPKI